MKRATLLTSFANVKGTYEAYLAVDDFVLSLIQVTTGPSFGHTVLRLLGVIKPKSEPGTLFECFRSHPRDSGEKRVSLICDCFPYM